MGRKTLIIILLSISFLCACEKPNDVLIPGGFVLSRLMVNNQNYTDSLFHYYPDMYVNIGYYQEQQFLILFYQTFCKGCSETSRFIFDRQASDLILNLKAPLWVRNTNRDANGEYVCDTCSYLKSLYGYEWGIEWDNPDTIRFHAIAKDTLLLEITANK